MSKDYKIRNTTCWNVLEGKKYNVATDGHMFWIDCWTGGLKPEFHPDLEEVKKRWIQLESEV